MLTVWILVIYELVAINECSTDSADVTSQQVMMDKLFILPELSSESDNEIESLLLNRMELSATDAADVKLSTEDDAVQSGDGAEGREGDAFVTNTTSAEDTPSTDWTVSPTSAAVSGTVPPSDVTTSFSEPASEPKEVSVNPDVTSSAQTSTADTRDTTEEESFVPRETNETAAESGKWSSWVVYMEGACRPTCQQTVLSIRKCFSPSKSEQMFDCVGANTEKFQKPCFYGNCVKAFRASDNKELVVLVMKVVTAALVVVLIIAICYIYGRYRRDGRLQKTVEPEGSEICSHCEKHEGDNLAFSLSNIAL